MTRGHSDRQYRDSLVYDLMELYRPAVDALVLGFLDRTTFTYGGMVRASNGQCMLHPQLAGAVVAGCRLEQETPSGAVASEAATPDPDDAQPVALAQRTHDAQPGDLPCSSLFPLLCSAQRYPARLHG